MIGRITGFGIALLIGAVSASLLPPVSAALLRAAKVLRLPSMPPAEPVAGTQPQRQVEAGPDRQETNILKLSDERIALARIPTAPARAEQLQRHISVTGTIVPAGDRITRVPVKVAGTISELRKRLGDTVQRGEVVAVIDSREIADVRSEFLASGVNLTLQRLAYERTQSLWERRVTAEQQYIQARATYQEAQLRHDLARQKLLALGLDPNDVSVPAPGDVATESVSRLRQYPVLALAGGRVVERRVDVGASVGQQNDPTEIYTIADLSTVWIELAVSLPDLPQLRSGQRVAAIATMGSAAGQQEGKIAFVSPLLDQNTRQARVVAEIPNPDDVWRPGTFVTADVIISDADVPIGVPHAALQTIGGETVVFVRVPGGFEKRSVTVGAQDHRIIEITAGLQAGEEIAVANTFVLKAEIGRSRMQD
ncbi:cobalt-zinc-cadmium efflux system membrane fusion protein [Phreatobacter oligotrophus]|uniref:Cobalt-zinc-cadmium efflux system membrane fusion protein n=2 Tax=Phreatobacter oligotrophus TaxID=1122261 RepID=A0A2T4YX38_9HYPH|nr:cobalt-zinc-cadmium efflux system membrane fusion protein [Phreatobacter oligotrophus]